MDLSVQMLFWQDPIKLHHADSPFLVMHQRVTNSSSPVCFVIAKLPVFCVTSAEWNTRHPLAQHFYTSRVDAYRPDDTDSLPAPAAGPFGEPGRDTKVS